MTKEIIQALLAVALLGLVFAGASDVIKEAREYLRAAERAKMYHYKDVPTKDLFLNAYLLLLLVLLDLFFWCLTFKL